MTPQETPVAAAGAAAAGTTVNGTTTLAVVTLYSTNIPVGSTAVVGSLPA